VTVRGGCCYCSCNWVCTGALRGSSCSGGCYDARVAPGSGVCREARGGACVMYKEGVTGRAKEQVKMREGSTGCTANGDNNCQTCNIQISDKLYCSQCATGYVPIDGTCTQVGDATSGKCLKAGGTAVGQDDTQCGQCGASYFLHKGGCYKFGSTVATLICNDPAASSRGRATAVDGVCSECNATGGFFKNPAASDATKQSCIACGDEIGADQYKGRSNCAMCTAPAASNSGGTATCTKCVSPKYLKAGACIDSCASDNTEFAKEDSVNGNKCVSCGEQTDGVEGCNTCTYDSVTKKVICTKCSGSNYLKTVAGTTTCVADCGTGFFKNDNGGESSNLKVCSPCAANCLTCADGTAEKCTSCTAGTHFLLVATGSQGKCVSCGDATSGVPNCAKCNPPTGNAKPTCSECGSGYKLEGETCVSTSVNLSSGAIAGIFITAVVVMGGLVDSCAGGSSAAGGRDLGSKRPAVVFASGSPSGPSSVRRGARGTMGRGMAGSAH
ncbi:Variant-specific surface protein, partial [Giardia duodenalis]